MPPDLARLQSLLTHGLTATADLWPDIERGYGWVHQAAQLLDNPDGLSVWAVRRTYHRLLAEMGPERDAPGILGPAVRHFRTVTRRYWPGLFCREQVPDLPRTNHDIEHGFGSARYHERRASGRKRAAPGMVVRGVVRVGAAVATRLQLFSPTDLSLRDRQRWDQVRQDLEHRHAARRAQSRFRRDPDTYLAHREDPFLKPSLPP